MRKRQSEEKSNAARLILWRGGGDYLSSLAPPTSPSRGKTQSVIEGGVLLLVCLLVPGPRRLGGISPSECERSLSIYPLLNPPVSTFCPPHPSAARRASTTSWFAVGGPQSELTRRSPDEVKTDGCPPRRDSAAPSPGSDGGREERGGRNNPTEGQGDQMLHRRERFCMKMLVTVLF